MNQVKSNPEELGTFISSPVNLETVGIYEVENYGSAMSPFYTILALWGRSADSGCDHPREGASG